VSVDLNHLPPDLDASLFNGNTGFHSVDMQNILQNEMDLNGGKLDFDELEPIMDIPPERCLNLSNLQQQVTKTATM